MDFRKAFYPTQREIEAQQKLIKEINHTGIQSFIDRGIPENEAKQGWDDYLSFWHSYENRGYYG